MNCGEVGGEEGWRNIGVEGGLGGGGNVGIKKNKKGENKLVVVMVVVGFGRF